MNRKIMLRVSPAIKRGKKRSSPRNRATSLVRLGESPSAG